MLYKEPELEPIRNRLLRLTTVTPTSNTTSNQNNSHSSGTSMSEKEWYNLCVMDLSKLFALSGH